MKIEIALFALVLLFACTNQTKTNEMKRETIGTIEKLDNALDSIISPAAAPEIIAEGFQWSEGPIWIDEQHMLLFSDVPGNTVYKWTEQHGKEVYLSPSGYTDSVKRGGEMGSNGLTRDREGNLILCQHGQRQMGRMDAPIDKPAPVFTTLAGQYNGKRLNSPNDAVYNSKGELFFTDPPYGLESQQDDDPKKELPFNGVYKRKVDGTVILLIDSLTRPNGLAFFPGEEHLLVANSDPATPYWYIYDMGPGDSLTNGRIFKDPSSSMGKGVNGLPDGLKIDRKGNVFATGPGGVWIFDRKGKMLGKIKLSDSASNCALSADEKILYITNHTRVLRLKMRD